jgi:hypothetical protein
MSGNILERDLAGKLGVTRDVLRDLRKRVLEAEDFAQQGRDVMIHADGVAKITGALAEKNGAEKKAVAIEIDDEESFVLLVHKLPPNRRIVLAKKEEADDEQVMRVRVRDNGHFVPGMRLRCRHLDGDLYELVGRCPRFKGRY